jgi:hypothetical protein
MARVASPLDPGSDDEGSIGRRIQALFERYEAEPRSLDVASQIADLYEHKFRLTDDDEDLAQAIQWITYCGDLSGQPARAIQPGTSIPQRLHVLRLIQLDRQIEALRDWFAAGGDGHAEAAQYRELLETLELARKMFPPPEEGGAANPDID